MKVFISTSSFGTGSSAPIDLLRQHGVEFNLNPYGRKLTESEVSQFISGATGLIAGTEPLTNKVLDMAPGLKIISRVGIGVDNIDLEAAAARGIAVFNTPDAPTESVAELALGGILSLVRSIHQMDQNMHQGVWRRQPGCQLMGKTVGIVGLGRIGKRVAELLQPFQVSILYCDVNPDIQWASAHGLVLASLEELLRSSDVTTLHLPGQKNGQCLIGPREIALMKHGSYLVNTSRGGLVDEGALLNALNSGKIAGAYLDTFQSEPYDGPLKDCPNALLTPHAGTSAVECRTVMEMEATVNLLRYLKAIS